MDIFIDPAFSEYYRKLPLVLVDAGASGGLDRKWKDAQKYLQVIAFEPDKRAVSSLIGSASSPSVRYLNVALYREKALLDLHLTRKQETSSIFKPNRAFLDKFPESDRFDILTTIQIPADTLDSQLEQLHIEDVDFLKVDVQGSELFVLEGATKALGGSIIGLEVEAEFVTLYDGQPLFSDIDHLLRGEGFQLFDLRPYYWKRKTGKDYGGNKGQLIFVECLYLKDIEHIRDTLSRVRSENSKKAKALRVISICILFGYLDFALEVFEEMRGLFNKDEATIVFSELKKAIRFSSKLPNFPGRGRLADLFYYLYKATEPTHHGWASVRRVLGNLE